MKLALMKKFNKGHEVTGTSNIKRFSCPYFFEKFCDHAFLPKLLYLIFFLKMPRRYRRSRRFKRRRLNRRRRRPVSRRYVRRAIDRVAEKKYVEFEWTPTSAGSVAGVGTTPVATEVTSVAIGTTDQTRLGDQITARTIRIRGVFHVSTTTPDVWNFCRIVVFQWQRTPDLQPINAGNFCFQNSLITIREMYNHDRRFNYRVLWDKVVGIAPGGTKPAVFFKKLIKIKKRRIQYADGATSAFNGGAYPIGIIAVTDSALEPHPILSLRVKFNYKDQ